MFIIGPPGMDPILGGMDPMMMGPMGMDPMMGGMPMDMMGPMGMDPMMLSLIHNENMRGGRQKEM